MINCLFNLKIDEFHSLTLQISMKRIHKIHVSTLLRTHAHLNCLKIFDEKVATTTLVTIIFSLQTKIVIEIESEIEIGIGIRIGISSNSSIPALDSRYL